MSTRARRQRLRVAGDYPEPLRVLPACRDDYQGRLSQIGLVNLASVVIGLTEPQPKVHVVSNGNG